MVKSHVRHNFLHNSAKSYFTRANCLFARLNHRANLKNLKQRVRLTLHDISLGRTSNRKSTSLSLETHLSEPIKFNLSLETHLSEPIKHNLFQFCELQTKRSLISRSRLTSEPIKLSILHCDILPLPKWD